MTEKEPDLSTLLNNESFIGWLRGASSTDEANAWQKWHNESTRHRQLTRKARKILNMPFNTPVVTSRNVQREIERFEKQFLRLVKKPDR